MIGRRALVGGAGAAGLLLAASAESRTGSQFGSLLRRSIVRAEKSSGGRLGVAVLDSGSNSRFAWRGDERFPMCSTFKFLLVAAVFQRVDQGRIRLQDPVEIHASDLAGASPVSERHVGGSLSVGELSEAVLVYSDNTAANRLLALIGGPEAWTAFARGLGDRVSRCDRYEVTGSESRPGDPRDTASPVAMLADMQRILLGDVLTEPSRRKLIDGMKACTTGSTRLRAGLPRDWVVGDRTGSGGYGTSNDLAIAWPPNRPPVLIASYLTEATVGEAARHAVLAEVGRAVARALG